MTSVADRPSTTSATPDPAEVIAGLRAAYDTGRTRSLEWRRRQVEGILRFCEERESDMAAALAEDLGRNAHDTWFGDIASTVGEAKYALKHLKRWMRPTRTAVPLALLPGRGSYRYEPLGVVLVIGAWNYPIYLCLGPMIGALAAGNSVVLKPSEHAPAASRLLAEALPAYLDQDAFRVVEGEAQITQQLIDARVDLVFFTGGTEIGRKVMEAASKHLTPVILELGGKSPVIVSRHADLAVAARRVALGKLLNSGQTCLAPDYVLVDEPVKDAFVQHLRTAISQMREGEADTQPIVNDRQFNRLAGLLDSGEVVQGGTIGDTAVAPTVVVDPAPDSPVMAGEIFGPIIPVLGVKDVDDAIAFVNAREKPLATYVFSNDKDEQRRVTDQVSAGGMVVNHAVMHVLAPQLPFGGVGESGMGAYHGKWGFMAFSHRKPVLVMPTKPDLSLMYPPYSARDKKLLRRLL